MDNDKSFRNNLRDYNININIINGIMAALVLNLVSPYYAKFAERLGASDYHIAQIWSLPALISVFALIPGAILIESFKNKKRITGIIMFINRLFYFIIAFVPFIDAKYRPLVFVLLVGIMNLPGSIAASGFQSTVGDIFEGEVLGRAMALRNKYSSIFGMAASYIAALIITKVPKTDEQTILVYQILFVITFLAGLGEVFSYFKFKIIKKSQKESDTRFIDSFKETVKQIPSEKMYLIFTGCSLIFYFGWQMGWPLFSIYTIKNLNANEVWLGVINIASSISSILTYTLWAKFANKKGSNYALFIATIGMSITPFLYAMSRSINELILFNILIGISVAGTTLILFNMLIEVTPSKNRTVYIAIYNTLINLSATISPNIGVFIKESTNIHTALIITGLVRFLGSIAFFMSYRYIKKGKLKVRD